MTLLDIRNLGKTFGKDTVAVDDFSLEVAHGEFVVLVGPSGCGKTTTLRMIAGIETADKGSIMLDGRDIARLGPEKRDIAMVFQDYALYPHLDVFDNIAFPLKVRKTPKEEVAARVDRICKTLGITDLKRRRPRQLSGGQRQRVAMGRALIREPRLFLMDEPLSNLDAKLRLQLRNEIAAIHRDLDATIIYVTHDQTEAMALADRIVVMDRGRIVQIGSPQQLYDEPRNAFVAEFIGTTPINLLEVRLTEGSVSIGGAPVEASRGLVGALEKIGKANFLMGVRPERMSMGPREGRGGNEAAAGPSGTGRPVMPGVEDVVIELAASFVYEESLGHETIYHYEVADRTPVSIRSHPSRVPEGGEHRIDFSLRDAICFDADSRERLFISR
jgi:multiple sugar transport system ATP-binding protein